MARLLDSFGEVSNRTSVGRIKALSVLKSPIRIQTYSGEKVKFIPTVKSPSIVSNTFGKLPKIAEIRSIEDRRSLFKQSNYTPDNNYDFSIAVTGQNLDSSISRYTIDSIFTENNPSESYLWNKQSIVSSSTKTLYFPNQGRIRFEVGDTVRIRNVNNLYSELFVVTESTFNSISYSSNNLLPEISGTFIDSGTTLYKFQTYNKNTATTSTTNLFTSIMAPGKRGVSTAAPIILIPDLRGSVSKISSVTKLINDGNQSSSYKVSQLEKRITKLKNDSDQLLAYKPGKVQQFKTSLILVPDFRNVSKVAFSSPAYKEVADLRKLPNKLSSITKLKNDSDQLLAYKPGKVQQFKTQFIAPVIDSRSTLYYGRVTIKLKNDGDRLLSYTPGKVQQFKSPLTTIDPRSKLDLLEKKFTVLKKVDDNLKPGRMVIPLTSLAFNIQLRKTETINKPLHKLNADGANLSVNNMQKASQSIKGLVDDFRVSRSNYVTKYKITSFAEVKFYATPNKILIPLNGVGVNYKAQTIQKKLTVVTSPSFNIKVNSFNIPINEFPNNIRKVNIIASNTLQSTVSTNVAPRNARENLYYAILAPGLRKGADYNTTSSFELRDRNYNFGKFASPIKAIALPNYQTANITSNTLQSTVSTNVAPRNARENLYYANLAQGLRRGAIYNTTSSYAIINANRDVANISANISQSTVSTTTSPINARENLYYANLAPGLRRGAVYNTTSSYVNIGNQYLIANISANISQSSVSTTTAPINARENLYYANLAPGLRRGAVYNRTSAYASVENIQIRNINVFQTKPVYKDLPIQFTSEKLSFYSPLDNLNLSEIRIEVTGQNLDSSISRYTIDSIFTENNPNESYLWNKQSIVSSSTKTLYFPIQYNQKFFAGDVVKIRNSNSGYIDYVYVISATTNSITYTSSNLLPEISGTFIESGTTVYSKLLSTTIGPNPLRNFNISIATPGKNSTKSFGYGSYSAASTLEVVKPYNIRKQIPSLSKGDVRLDFATKIKSITTLKKDPNLFDVNNLNIQKIRNIQQFDFPADYATSKLNSITKFKDIPTSFVVNNMARYDIDSSGNSPDFTLAIIDQSLNQFSNYYYNTETIFIENAPTDGYIWGSINRIPSTQQPTTKTLYFANQRRFIFTVGEKVRVRNATTGRSTLETVVSCEFDSVTISLPSIPITEITNTFIDSGFTTYRQNFVRTTSSAKNSRELFYYSNMAQGFKSANKYSSGTSYADTPSLNNTTFKLPYTNTVPKTILKPVYKPNYQNINFVAKFITGDFKRGSTGIIDPAVIKKAPIQFWS